LTDAMYEVPSQKGLKKLSLDEKYVSEKLDKSNLGFLKVA